MRRRLPGARLVLCAASAAAVASACGDPPAPPPDDDAPPTVAALTVETDEDAPVTFTVVAEDPDGDPLEVTIEAPRHGAIVLDGLVGTYTPEPEWSGEERVRVWVRAGDRAATTALRLVVAAVNDAPVAVDDQRAAVEDVVQALVPAVLLTNDTDADGDALTITAVGAATHGAVALAGGQVVFTPEVDHVGPATFEYTVSDGHGGADTATVTLTIGGVNDAPVAVADALTVPRNTATSIAAATLIGNDLDADGDTLTVTAVTAATHGTVALAGATITFTPAPGYVGPAGFAYAVTDGVATATAAVAVAVVTTAPVAVDDALTTQQDVPVTVAAATLLANDVDPDGDALEVVAVGAAVDGTVELAGGDVTFTPASGFHGVASFDYTISDGGATDTGRVWVTVAGCGDGDVEGDEQCDDGNTDSGDGCSSSCEAESCGDGVVNDFSEDRPSAIRFEWVGAGCEQPYFVTVWLDGEELLLVPWSSSICLCEPGIDVLEFDDPEVLAMLRPEGNDVAIDISNGLDEAWVSWITVGGEGTGIEHALYDYGGGGDAEAHNPNMCEAGYGYDVRASAHVALMTEHREECDDGNHEPGDGCDPDCQREPVCGDGFTDAPEVCDDGNDVSGDGCRADCTGAEQCGDGLLDPLAGEACDDGNRDSFDGCDWRCHLEVGCGNGVVDPGEACDDGNRDAGDGCRGDCAGVEVCGDGHIDWAVGEQCDDGDLDDGDGCDAGCQLAPYVDVAAAPISGTLSCGYVNSNGGRKAAVDQGGRLYVLLDCAGGLYVVASDDHGVTWSPPTAIGAPIAVASAIEGGPPGVVYVALYGGSPSRPNLYRSLDGGITWEGPQVFDTNILFDFQTQISLDAHEDGVWLSAGYEPFEAWKIDMFYSLDRGAPGTFSHVQLDQHVTAYDVVVDKITGTVWSVADNQPRLYVRHSLDRGAHFRPEVSPLGERYGSDWAGSNGFLYVVGAPGTAVPTDDTMARMPMDDPEAIEVLPGLPPKVADHTRVIDADALGNAYIATPRAGGGVQLDRLRAGAAAIEPGDSRVIATTGTEPGVVALPNNAGALVVYAAGGHVYAAIVTY